MHEAEGWAEREAVNAGGLWRGREMPGGFLPTGGGAAGEVEERRGERPGRLPWLESTLSRLLPGSWSGDAASARSGAGVRGGLAAGRERVAGGQRVDGRQRAADSLGSVAHDVRNMMAALDLYCDLLEEPGVLDGRFRHYAGELRLVAGACRNLAGRLAELHPESGKAVAAAPEFRGGMAGRRMAAERQVENLAEELLANKNLLSALAGPGITVGMHFDGGARAIALAGEDLTRVLINLVKNAAEAMPSGGHIQIGLEEREESLVLSVEDCGTGLEEAALEAVFSPGYSTRVDLDPEDSSWPVRHQGLGLAIVRSLVAAAGGSVWAQNRGAGGGAGSDGSGLHGAVFTMEFPARE